MKNISIIIEIDFILHVFSSSGNVLRKHRLILNVTVLYVFSFFSISGHSRLNTDHWLKITTSVGKDKQLARTSILKAMMMLKKAWGEATEQTI